jgi:hypothetical protein
MEQAPDTLIPHDRSYYVYPCPHCGFENRSKVIHGSGVPVTKQGAYGSDATPQPVAFADEMYRATTISFVAADGSTPAYLSDSEYRFGEKSFSGTMPIRVETTSGTNDGDYTIADRGVTRGEILLSSSDSLTSETAAASGTVVLSRVIYKPFTSTSGCPFCGNMNSKPGG